LILHLLWLFDTIALGINVPIAIPYVKCWPLLGRTLQEVEF
jgi:hypothetical protein